MKLPLAGTLPELDELAQRFLSAGSSAAKGALLKEAKAAAKEVGEKDAASAKYYLSVMKKIHAQAQGEGVIVGCGDDESVHDCEKQRIEKKLKDRRTPEKTKKGLRENLNVLATFAPSPAGS